MKFIDLFSGIGGFRSGLEMNGHECLAYAEIDKYARQSYKAIYNTNGEEEWEDVTKITDEEFRKYRGVADVIVGGFPCQAFSLAGKRKGFEDTRGTLFFEVARAIKEIQPSYALLENVKGLLSHDKGRTFGTIIQALDELGYVTEWGLFNSKFWGVPQNRERVFILVTRKDVFTEPKLFNLLNQQKTTESRLIDILEKEVDEKYYLDEKRIKNFKSSNRNVGHGLISILGNTSKTGYNRANVHDTVGITPTLAARDYKDPIQILEPKRVSKDFKEIVKVRKYSIDTEKLSQLLKESKSKCGVTSRQIAEKLNTPKTKVEHYFRTDSSFAIPDSEIWEDLKAIINFNNNEFDKAIHTFIDKESEFDTSNRIYDSNYISPTLNTVGQPKIIQLSDTDNNKETLSGNPQYEKESKLYFEEQFKIRKLTPIECWRLQGFTDEQFYKAKNDGVSNSQLYKQAGNSVTVNVIDAIIKEVLK